MTKKLSAYFLLLAIGTFYCNTNTAQIKPVPLQLSVAIKAATENNSSIQLAQLDEQLAKAQLKQTEAIYLPQLGFSYTGFTTNNPLNAFGFKLQQQNIQQSDFNPSLLNHPEATANFSTKIELIQPIINLDLTFLRKSAAKQTEVYQFKTQRTAEYVALQVKNAYLQLQLSYAAEKVVAEALQTAKAILTFTSNRYEQGFLQKPDVLNVEVQVKMLESKLQETNSNIANASDFLSNLMHQHTGVMYTTDSLTAWNYNTADSTTQRADFKAMEAAIEAYNLQIKSTQNTWLPKLNGFAHYQLNDKKMFGFGSSAYLAGIQISWDIFKGNSTKNKVAYQTIERNKIAQSLSTEKENNSVEVLSNNRKINDAAFFINQQKTAIQQAREALTILENRYKQGLVNTTDVLMAHTQLSQQQLKLQEAIYQFNSAVAYAQFLQPTNQ